MTRGIDGPPSISVHGLIETPKRHFDPQNSITSGGARSLRSRVLAQLPGPNLKLIPAFTTLTLVVMPTLLVTKPHGAPVAQTKPVELTELKP